MSVTVPFAVIPVATRWRAQSLGTPVALLSCLPSDVCWPGTVELEARLRAILLSIPPAGLGE